MNIEQLETKAHITLSIADYEGWRPENGTRILANLALEAAALLRESEEAQAALTEMRRLFGANWQEEVKRFEGIVREL